MLACLPDRILAAMRARPVARLSLADGQDEVAAGTVGAEALEVSAQLSTAKRSTAHQIMSEV